MNKHLQRNLFLLLFFSVVGIAMYFNFKADENYRQLLRSDLADIISQNQTGEIPVVDFSTITTFVWDRLFVFGPYTSPEQIDSSLGSFWLGSRFTSIKSSDRVTLLVFTKNGHVVQYLEFPRGWGDFSMVDNELGYTIEESRFIVDETGRMIWIDAK